MQHEEHGLGFLFFWFGIPSIDDSMFTSVSLHSASMIAAL